MFRIIGHAGCYRADFAKLAAPKFSAPHCQLFQPTTFVIMTNKQCQLYLLWRIFVVAEKDAFCFFRSGESYGGVGDKNILRETDMEIGVGDKQLVIKPFSQIYGSRKSVPSGEFTGNMSVIFHDGYKYSRNISAPEGYFPGFVEHNLSRKA